MIYNELGSTGIKVSKMCFGSLTLGPLQANLSLKEGANVIKQAFSRGVNFIDTAELYETYPYIKEALKDFRREDIIISSKSYAYDTKTASRAFEDAISQLDTDYIDIFMLHEQESEHTVRGHYEALEYYMKLKKEGYIRAIGLSTHFIDGVKAVNKYSEFDIVHPIFNKAGLGIQGGNIDDMISELTRFKAKGGGIFAMKPLGGGNLLHSIDECFDFVLSSDIIDSFAIGMQSVDEVISNIHRVTGKKVPLEIETRLKNKKRKLVVADWCTGCSECVKRCRSGGITLVDNRATPNDNCILCGYCSAVCPDFCIKVI